MGNYRARRPGYIQGWQIDVAECTFRGLLDDEIIEKIWHVSNITDPEEHKKKMRSYRQRLRNLRKTEEFREYYKSIITEWTTHNVGRALTKLSEQIDSPESWLANKAANDVLQRGMKLFDDEESNQITVRIEGMPELGSPGDDDD